MTSATERLRALLDERGVKWMPSAFDPPHETFYKVNGVGFIVTEFPEIQRMSLSCDVRITPEQAVAATLGPGTCRIELPGTDYQCNGCGEIVGSTDPTSELYIDGNAIELWNYCPNCGRRVVR